MEFASGSVIAVRNAHEDPDEDDGNPAGKTVVALKEAVRIIARKHAVFGTWWR